MACLVSLSSERGFSENHSQVTAKCRVQMFRSSANMSSVPTVCQCALAAEMGKKPISEGEISV